MSVCDTLRNNVVCINLQIIILEVVIKVKKASNFLWISLSFFALSLVVFFVKIALLYYEFKTTASTLAPNDFIRFEYNFVVELFAYIMFGIPTLLLELSCIRSVYRILKYKPRDAVRICLLISAILSFSAFAFQVLMFAGALDLTQDSGSIKLQETVLLLSGWPVVILSFVLGIDRKKQQVAGVERVIDSDFELE